ncbi:heat shock protein DnaJ domain protein [Rhodomicrobium vannielii ATCC 17100]|uniref:Heat shock protein DnaJ domain protein n=2 Tax=Rhodomicrobium vannielii TaxID=1069 RepID=E3I846_RHOVT|nr:heat shock protein DnaJ domain protein [Rhodomicrobium vannielii ATCC 17100]
MLSYPRMARKSRCFPLLRGITFLLEIAAAEPDALQDAAAITGQTEATLRQAAGFFIEQVMLDEGADLYRMLGTNPAAPAKELRRHMALIMRWLHPDLITIHERDGGFNRSLYANRIVFAWETVKSPARRSAYDSTRAKTVAVPPKKPPLRRRSRAKSGRGATVLGHADVVPP